MYWIYSNIIIATNSYMFPALLAHHQGVQWLYRTTACYIDLLHEEEVLEILQCRICIAHRIVRRKLEKFVNMLKVFTVPETCGR